MAHRNARLTPHGRRLLVERVRARQPVAHVAKAMGVSRQCAHRWDQRVQQRGRLRTRGPLIETAHLPDPDAARHRRTRPREA